MKRKSNGLSSLFLLIVLVFIVITIGGTLLKRTNGFTTGLKSFYLTVGSEEIHYEYEDLKIEMDKDYKFYINGSSGKDYNVRIVPNLPTGEELKFTADGKETSYSSMVSLVKGFVLTGGDDYFTLRAEKDLPAILGCYFENVSGVENVAVENDKTPASYFKCIVSLEDESDFVTFTFGLVKGEENA